MVQTVLQHPEGDRTITRVKLSGFSNFISFFIFSKGANAISMGGGAAVPLAHWHNGQSEPLRRQTIWKP